MSGTNKSGLTLGNLLATLLCTGLLGLVAFPALTDLKQRMAPVLCANNLRACNQAWNVYAAVNADTWMHFWDRSGDFITSMKRQAPYTMWYYTMGEIPPGAAFSSAGWWNPEINAYGDTGPYMTLLVNKWDGTENKPTNTVYHCPTTAAQGTSTNPIWHPYTSYSYAVLNKNYGTEAEPNWRNASGLDYFYPKPSLFSHAATTLQLCDMGGMATESRPNAWCTYNILFQGQHGGKANNVFADGHVELLTLEEFQAKGEEMFRPYYVPSGDGQ